MDKNAKDFIYGEAKVIGKVSEGIVHFMTLIDEKLPFTLVYQKGKTEYSPNHYEILYGDTYTNHFDECSQLTISPDGKSILYIITSDGKNYLYLNDKELQSSDERIGDIEFSDDGKNYAYFLEKDGLWEVYLNDVKVSKEFDYYSTLVFLPDGSLGFLGQKDGTWHYYSTTIGELPHKFLKVGWLFRSPICDRAAFFCAKSTIGSWIVYIDDKKLLGPFDCMGLPMASSPSHKNYAFTVVKENKWYIYINEQKINRDFDVIDFLAFLPNDKDIVCSEVKNDGTRIYLNDRLIAGPFEKLGFEMAFSQDCKRIYYSQCENEKWSIGHTDIDDPEKRYIKDIDITIPCSEVFNLLVSPDLSRIVYSTLLEKKNFYSEKTIVSLGELGTFGIFETTDFFKISNDGSVIAFTAKEEESWYLYVNGKKVSGPFLAITGINFFENTSIIVYKAVISHDQSFPIFMMYMDGKNYTGQVDEHRMMYMEGNDTIIRQRINKSIVHYDM